MYNKRGEVQQEERAKDRNNVKDDSYGKQGQYRKAKMTEKESRDSNTNMFNKDNKMKKVLLRSFHQLEMDRENDSNLNPYVMTLNNPKMSQQLAGH